MSVVYPQFARFEGHGLVRPFAGFWFSAGA